MKNKFAENLKSLLEETQTSVKELAEYLNVGKSVVYYWLNKQTTPNIEFLIMIADYFNVCADYLLGRQDYY